MSRLAPYAQIHSSPDGPGDDGPGDDRPTAAQIVRDQNLVGKLQGKVFFITGCSSGIGVETAKAIHSTGADVYITARDMKKGGNVAKDILSDNGPGKVDVIPMELDSFASIKAGAAKFLEKSNQLNVLINNAEGQTKDGFETQFGTNHLGHFLLFQLLKPTLLASSAADFNSRVVVVSSVGHRGGQIHFGDFAMKKAGYTPWKAYGQSKLATLYFATELDRRYGNQGLHSMSLHPGGIATPLQRHLDEETLKMNDQPEVKAYMKSPEQGAATSVWAAVAQELEGKGGVYLEDCAIAEPQQDSGMLSSGYAAEAFNEENERRLWEESLQMVGMSE
ncbi:hypothetical protein LTR28_008748 [Elasticomyces elasticus]|nr:hypothetical protein LTR28_008748 [Elasticomyces elasticus]